MNGTLFLFDPSGSRESTVWFECQVIEEHVVLHRLNYDREPNINETIKMTFADYVARRDPVFERADAGGNGTRVSLCKL